MSNESHEIILKNSYVYDEINKIFGEKKDLLIRNGKIVDSLSSEHDAKEIDASGCVSFPGFIDLRSHVFAQETMYHNILSESNAIHLLHTSINEVEKAVLNQGFTFLCEMDVPVTQSKIALQNMGLSKALDHGIFLDIGSNWSFLGELESESAPEKVGYILAYLMELVKGLGISVNCPYHQQFWKFEELSQNAKIPMVPLTSLQIYNLFTEAANITEISPNFVSPFGMGDFNKNQMEFLKEMNQTNFILSSVNQFILSENTEFTQFHTNHHEFFTEISPVSFGNIYPLITRDRNLAIRCSEETNIPITLVDLEFDTEFYVTGRKMESSTNPDNWYLMLKALKKSCDLSRILLSSNFPYNMDILDWASHLHTLVREGIELSELGMVLSSNPARVIGFDDRKGHLGIGADADIVCFSTDPEKLDEKSFRNTSLVIKGGAVVKKENGYFLPKKPLGNIYWKQGTYKKDLMHNIQEKLENFYNKRFSMHLHSLENLETNNMEKL